MFMLENRTGKLPVLFINYQYLTAVAVMITVTSLIPQMFFIL